MINVNELYQFVNFVANKSQASGNITPSQFNLVLKRAYTQWVTERYNDPNKFAPGENTPARYGYQLNQKITDDIKHLIVDPKVYQVNSEGRLNYPDDYLHISSCRFKYKKQLSCGDTVIKEVDVKAMKDSEIGHILTSQIVEPTRRYPYLAFYSDYIQFFPKDLGQVTMTYLKKPEEPIWSYTLVNGRPVYDDTPYDPVTGTGSRDVDAPDEAMNEIAFRMLSFLGMNIREPQLVQYSEQLKAQGV
jgi:hypothetical protein